MTTALLIIDVQCSLTTGTWEVFESRRVIDRINHVSRTARAAGVPVIVVQHEAAGGPMTFQADGWQLDPELEVAAIDIPLRKTASDAFHNSALQTVLQSHGVTALIVCGMQSDLCVDSTIRRALALGYPVTLVADGHTTMDNAVLSAAQISAHHAVTWSSLDSYGPRVRAVPASELRIEP